MCYDCHPVEGRLDFDIMSLISELVHSRLVRETQDSLQNH